MGRNAACCVWALAALIPVQGQTPPAYTITTVAGNGTSGYTSDGVQATTSELAAPFGIALDSSGALYIADQANHRIRKVGTDGNITTVAGNGTSGYSGDKASATSAALGNPLAVIVDSSGNLYISDTTNQVIRKVSGGNITTYAGINAAGYAGDGATATGAAINNPAGLALDSSGNLFFADTANNLIRKITTANIISLIAGTLNADYCCDGGPAKSAKLNNPEGVAIDAAGNIYVADTNNHRIRKIAAGTNIITTVAGTGTNGFSGDGGLATKAMLNYPKGLALDGVGNIYIADSFNNRIRVVMTNGNIYTIAGTGKAGYTGNSGPALSAQINGPASVAVGSAGIYFSDNQNNVIRLLTPPAGNLPAINTGGIQTAGAFGGSTAVARGSWIEIYGANLAGTTRLWTGADFNGNTAPTSLEGTKVTIGGENAFIDYISPSQVNAQVPSTTGFGSQPVIVTTSVGSTPAVSVTVNSAQPGLFAPPLLTVGGKQYAGALFTDGATYALPAGAVSGITSKPARPGDPITLYGVGFGTVNPDTPAGQIASGTTATTSIVQVFFGDSEGTLSYAGLAPGAVGLYQFNVVVPNVAAGDAVPLTFRLGGVPGAQTLYIAIQN